MWYRIKKIQKRRMIYMKLNEKALKQSMENAKKNFNIACDSVVDFA